MTTQEAQTKARIYVRARRRWTNARERGDVVGAMIAGAEARRLRRELETSADA